MNAVAWVYLFAGLSLAVVGLGYLAWQILYGPAPGEWSFTAFVAGLAIYALVSVKRLEKGDRQ